MLRDSAPNRRVVLCRKGYQRFRADSEIGLPLKF